MALTRNVNIAGRPVGDGERCFIIAEAGSNHNGSLEHAKRLIDVAVDAEADAVKFQLFRAAKLYPKAAGRSDYLNLDRSIYDVIADMEMPYEWLPELAEYCGEKGIIFMSSAFDEESVDRLDPYVPAYKVASYEMTHLPLVRHIAWKGKPVVISTGTANLEEVDETVEAFFATGNRDLMLMQCTASYPAPVEALKPPGNNDHEDGLRGPSRPLGPLPGPPYGPHGRRGPRCQPGGEALHAEQTAYRGLITPSPSNPPSSGPWSKGCGRYRTPLAPVRR